MSEENAGEEWAGGPYSTMACIKGLLLPVLHSTVNSTHC